MKIKLDKKAEAESLQLTNKSNIQNEEANIFSNMQADIKGFCDKLIEKEFNVEQTSEHLICYIKTYNRILYSVFSNIIYAYYEENDANKASQIVGMMSTNIEKLIKYLEEENKEDSESDYYKDARKASIKIWDHINLAQQQYSMLKLNDDDYKRKIDKSLEPFKNNLSSELNSQLLTMIGIFTSLAFLLFGGISSLDNLFSNENMPTLKFIIVGLIWGLCLINLLFIFMFCVSKMANLALTKREDGVTVFQHYSIVIWSNFILISSIIISLWAYYLKIKNSCQWLDNIIIGREAEFTENLLAIIVITSIVLIFLTSGIKNKIIKKLLKCKIYKNIKK